MADDAPATFDERFTGEPPPPPPQPAATALPTGFRQYAAEQLEKAKHPGPGLFAGLGPAIGAAGGMVIATPEIVANGIADLLTKSHKAWSEGLTPSEEVEFGVNAAPFALGGGEEFKIPKSTAAAFDNFHEQVIKPIATAAAQIPQPEPPRITIPLTPENVKPDFPPPGVARSRLALTGEPHVDSILNSPATKQVIDNPVVDRTHDVPYTAGGSVPLQDPTMFIDKHFPRSFTIDGRTFDPADPFAVHENVEQHTMDLLTKGGMTPEEAYRVAHFEFAEKAEGAWYAAHGIDKERAEAAYAPYMAAIQHGEGTDFPPNLYKRPYPHDQPSAAKNEAITEPRPSPDEINRAKQIIADWQAKGAPAPEPEAPPKVNPLQEAHDLGAIGPPREPVPTDNPAAAAQRAIPANAKQGDKITMTPNGEPINDWDSRFKDWVHRLDAPDDIKPLILDAAERNDKWASTRATGEVNPAHVDVLADAAGVDPTKLDRSFIRANFDNDAKIRMAKQYLDTTIDDFLKASDKAASDPTPENHAAMIEAEIKRDLMLEQMVGGYRSEWGRSGHALRDLLAARKAAPTTGLADEIKKKMAQAPKSVTDAIDAARETLDKAGRAKPGDEEFGLDKLIKAAQALVDETAPKEGKPKAPPLPSDVKELVKTANAVVKLMERPVAGERVDTVRPLPKIYREGQEAPPKNALVGFNALVTEAQRTLVEGMKQGKTVREAMPKELRDMVDASQNVTSHFGGTGLQRAIQDLLAKKGRTPEDMQTIARSMRGLSNEQAARILTDMNGKQQPWYYWAWQQGLISGEVTHTKYVVSNFGFSTLDRVAAPGVAALIGKLHGGERVFFGEPVMGMYGLIRGVPNALRAAREGLKTGMRVPLAEEMQLADRMTARGERLPRDLLHTQSVPYGNPGAPDWGIWQRVLNQKQLEGATRTIGVSGRMAAAIHGAFKNLNVEASKRSRAYHAAANEVSNPLSKEFEDRYSYHLAHPTDETLRGSVQDGYSGTYMDKLGPMEERLAAAIRDTKFKWAFPFMHIPINIVRQTIKYSPAAWVSKGVRDDLMGRNGQPAQDLAISKMVIGSSIVGYFISKGMNGEATGDYPLDTKERNEWKMNDKIPNAMQHNGQWVQMQRFGPPGNLAQLGADWGSIIRTYSGKTDESTMEKATNIIGHMMLSAVHMIANEVGLQSIQNLFDAFEGKQSVAELAAYEASTFIPFSSFVRQTASILDPNARQARTLLDGFKMAIPGVRNTLMPKRDPVYGEPVANPGYGTPFRQVPVGTDFAKQELTRIGYFPTAPEPVINGVKLTPEQFDKYEATAGPLVKAALSGEVRSPQWQAHNGNPQWQTTIAKQIIAAARAKARGAMQIDDQGLIDAARQRRLKQINGVAQP